MLFEQIQEVVAEHLDCDKEEIILTQKYYILYLMTHSPVSIFCTPLLE